MQGERISGKISDRHIEQPPRAQILTEARAWMLIEARARTNRHTKLKSRMSIEARTRMIKEALERTFILRVREFLMIVRACTEARA